MKNYDSIKTGNLINTILIEREITQKKFAEMMGVSEPCVTKWIKGEGITTANLLKVSRVLHITFEEIYYGELMTEGHIESIKRNYEVNGDIVEHLISTGQEKAVVSYYEKCLLNQKRYLELLERWSEDDLTPKEEDEIIFISNNIRLDYYNFPDYQRSYPEDNAREVVRNFLLSLKNKSPEEQIWQIERKLTTKFVIKIDEIYKAGMFKAFEAAIKVLSQYGKDTLLREMIKDSYFADISYNQYIKALLNEGANIILSTLKMVDSLYDDEVFDHLEEVKPFTSDGEKTYRTIQDIERKDREDELTYLEGSLIYREYKTYKTCIDVKATQHLKDLYTLRKSKPAEYIRKVVNNHYMYE